MKETREKVVSKRRWKRVPVGEYGGSGWK